MWDLLPSEASVAENFLTSWHLEVCVTRKHSQYPHSAEVRQPSPLFSVTFIVHCYFSIEVFSLHTVVTQCVGLKNPFSVAPPTLCGYWCLQSLMQTTKKFMMEKKKFFTHRRRVFQSRANCTVWRREAERWGGDCIPSSLQLEQIQMSMWQQVKQSIFVYITARVPSAVSSSLEVPELHHSGSHITSLVVCVCSE